MAETVKPQLASHDHCTGCGACASGCPKGAVHMVRDKEGFLYPQITDGCVGCGHCAHVCPALKQREVRSAPAVFAVWNEDEAVRAHSTAGGVFTALAEFALECGGVVFGAALDEKLQVRHIVVKTKRICGCCGARNPSRANWARRTSRCRCIWSSGGSYCSAAPPVR